MTTGSTFDQLATRRGFLKGAAACGALCGMPAAVAEIAGAAAARGRSYSVPVLGDIHFDSPDRNRYHADYTHSTTTKRYKAHLKEHVRNAEMWKERMPGLVRASGACARADAAFALQVGDFVQGDCGNAATHRRMLDDAFTVVKGAYGGRLPLVLVAGNHDIRGDIEGDGAQETLEKWLPEKVSKELGVSVPSTTYSFRQGPDVFIVVDFNDPKPDLALVKRLLSESADARYTFVVSHGPVIPNGKSRWFLLGKEGRDAERRELRALLARRNAIALCGHGHRSFMDERSFFNEGGRVCLELPATKFPLVAPPPGAEGKSHEDKAHPHQCVVMNVYDGLVEFERIDFMTGKALAEPWRSA
jgi:hypothetical protein